MRIDIATLFVEMCEAVMNESIIGRARAAGHIDLHCHNIRDYSPDMKHHRVDDSPYGGGKGMLMQPEPIFACYEDICRQAGHKPYVIYLSPQGKVFNQHKAKEMAKMDHILLLCGHYEGVDQRVIDEIVDEELSIGDYVLTGGELGALVVADAVCRLCPGVLPEEECFTQDSHWNGLLEYPQYTRPPVWHGREVPEVLQSGHHGNIESWRHQRSLENTLRKRPDLMKKARLDAKDKKFVDELRLVIKAEKEAAEAADAQITPSDNEE
jgi:tRNA (guanine37-N1)-methyltransferase